MPKNKLLLVIDLQKGWLHPIATTPTMLKAVELCQNFDGDVIHCCFKNDPESLFHKQLNWKHFVDSPEIDQIPEVQKLNLPTYWRSTYSCVNDETRPIIRDYTHVYIAGVFTDISVASTAMDIFDLGVPVSVVADCVATLHGSDVHKAALKSLDMALGKKNIINATDILY